MKKLFLPSCFVIVPLLLLTSCSRTITCHDGNVNLKTVGFSRSDFDSMVVTRYTQDNAFDKAIDSTTFVGCVMGNHDTGSLNVYAADNLHNLFLNPGYDYKIVMPAVGKTYLLTKIVQAGNTHQTISTTFMDGKDITCYNNTVSCNLNGTPITTPSATNGDIIVTLTR